MTINAKVQRRKDAKFLKLKKLFASLRLRVEKLRFLYDYAVPLRLSFNGR
jgi:hypothetical protein